MGIRLETYDGNGNLISTTDNRIPADVSAAMQDSVTDYRDNVLLSDTGTIWFNGYEYDCDPTTRSNLTAAISYILLGQTLPSNFVWRDALNNNIPQTNDSLTQLYAGICSYVEACYVASWTIKGNIASIATQNTDNATILSQLDAFDITQNWPSNDLTPTVPHNY